MDSEWESRQADNPEYNEEYGEPPKRNTTQNIKSIRTPPSEEDEEEEVGKKLKKSCPRRENRTFSPAPKTTISTPSGGKSPGRKRLEIRAGGTGELGARSARWAE